MAAAFETDASFGWGQPLPTLFPPTATENLMEADMAKRDYVSSPVSDRLGLQDIILGLADDLSAMRAGKISPQDGIARATVAKQLFNGVRLYLQAIKTLEMSASVSNPPALTASDGNE